jgi:hypothetical protein
VTIRRETIDGRKATVADMPNGLVKILFDDGDMIIAAPAKDAPEAPPGGKVDRESDESGTT